MTQPPPEISRSGRGLLRPGSNASLPAEKNFHTTLVPPSIEVERLDLGPSVLLRGPVLMEVAWLVGLGLQALRRRDGVAPWPRLTELQRALTGAAADQRRLSAIGQPDVRPEVTSASSEATTWIGTAEVATALGISQRQAQRLGSQLGVRHGRAYRFDAAAVEAYGNRQEHAA